ncbi:MAG TPA: hypothetical protein VGL72_19725 [Bryobacteraceae bacterium]|jgi:hypothetical protein
MSSATYTITDLPGNTWQYSLTLTDTGTTNIGTFWFAWKPGQDYMPTVPGNISSPTGWTDNITGLNNASDGNAIQWLASTPGAV